VTVFRLIAVLLDCCDDGGRCAAENHLTTSRTSHPISGFHAADVIVEAIGALVAPPHELRTLVNMLIRVIGSPADGRGHVSGDVTSGSRVCGAGRVDRRIR